MSCSLPCESAQRRKHRGHARERARRGAGPRAVSCSLRGLSTQAVLHALAQKLKKNTLRQQYLYVRHMLCCPAMPTLAQPKVPCVLSSFNIESRQACISSQGGAKNLWRHKKRGAEKRFVLFNQRGQLSGKNRHMSYQTACNEMNK